jgi:hypothetical protein
MNENKQQMMIYWEQGFGVSEISRKLNLCTGYVSRSLKSIYGDTQEKRHINNYRIYTLNEDFF